MIDRAFVRAVAFLATQQFFRLDREARACRKCGHERAVAARAEQHARTRPPTRTHREERDVRGNGLRHQFNAPEAIAVLQQDDDEAAYWKRVLNYCANGNLQAVLDEYMHLLYEAEAGANASAADAILKVAGDVFEAASIRTSQLRPDYPQVHDGKLSLDPNPLSLRCRYAVRYGDAVT